MRAAVLRSTPGTLVVEDVTIDNPGRSEVVVRTAAAGVCHSDLHFVEGAYSHPTPCVLGHESAGVVEAVGEDVTDVRVGDHVITCLAVFCGSCERCLGGRPALCQRPGATRRTKGAPPRLSLEGETVHQFFHLSSFAEQMLVTRTPSCRSIPTYRSTGRHSSGAASPPSGRRLPHGAGATWRHGRRHRCGGIGLNAIQGARVAGAARIIGIDLSPTKLELATSFAQPMSSTQAPPTPWPPCAS
jgi:S-(hydroxymethyl)glutathione dehydrogenase/alcohol dehydrogenase